MKYILEVEDEAMWEEQGTHFHKCTDAPWWSIEERNLDKLTPYDEKEEYKRGLEDAWDAVRYQWHNGKLMFDVWTAKELMDEYHKTQKQKEYQVGDIITDGNKNYLIVSIGENSYVAMKGTDFEPVYIGKDFITQYRNIHDRKDMDKVIECLRQ